jgi:signal transduction histidine kinase
MTPRTPPPVDDEVPRSDGTFEQIPALAWATDSGLRILWTVGDAFQAANRSLVGKTLQEAGEISERSIRAHQDALRGRSSRFEGHFRDRIAQVGVEPHRNAAGKIIGALGIAVDVTDSKRAGEELAHRLLEAQEGERRSIARELHDDFGQVLTAIRLNLQGGARAAESIQLVDDAIQRMRDLALDLRPAILDDLGLEAALRWYVAREAGRAGLAFRLDVESIGTRLAPALETACFRLVQEALTNVVRHAQADEVEVKLDASEGEVRVSISDDGKGFDVRAGRRRAAAGGSQGLLIMEERVSLAGGKLEIRSGRGGGTTVAARIPIPGARQ